MTKPVSASAALVALALAAGCGEPASTEPRANIAPETEAPAAEANVLELRAVGLEFEGPGEIASGWTTIRLENASDMAHFAIVQRRPEGVTIEQQSEEVASVFQAGFDLLAAGEADAAMETFGGLPAWYADVVFLGGPGMVTGGETTEATVYLEPGSYTIECYVKTNGVFHSYNPDPEVLAMLHDLVVTEDDSGAPEPEADYALTVSSEGYAPGEGSLAAGANTIRVEFADQTAYGNFVGHDVHVVQLGEDVDRQAVIDWMDWTQPGGLETPAPAVFVGGLNEMPAGAAGYFTVDLEPGEYAFISETPAADEKALFLPFTIEG
ncbi:hypothetical protein DDZ18_03120 [Marinicauda salina]|uniref:DUF4382 domain-containing protein n=1 Tax=Marinicauda salina TaxID=2135793 RepID=A0A2U2BX91_9PROT|nr:hypothetical protein [Marinicauda salina]PWE18610.1 hypothetical protein DDZ18_03120 [Marinicauda salina]